MRTRIVLPIVLLALTTGAVFLTAQEMPQPQIANWPAPASWEPPARTSGGFGTEGALAVAGSSPMPFIAVTPCRIIDTRLSGGAFGVGETRTYAMSGGSLPCVTGFPSSIAAVSLNITVTQTAGTGFVTGYQAFTSLPVAATLTWIGANQTLSNAAVVPTGSSFINIYASQVTHVILDINGFYAGASVGATNTFLGPNAGNSTLTGTRNAGIGTNALSSDTSGNFNVAVGDTALQNNTTGGSNTGVGLQALNANTTGNFNTGLGVNALFASSTGDNNTAVGREALFFSNGASNNTAVGLFALRANTSGQRNIAVGSNAGANLTTGDDNIDIGHPGVAGESAIIRIGNQAVHTTTFIAGIFASFPLGGGSAVFANSNGELSTNSSAGRFKEDIEEIGEASEGLMKLRPVAFKYKPEFDPTGLKQYGLIAEEVAQVYPELVLCDRDGKPFTVQYHLVNALLLNEVQKQHRTVEAQEEKIDNQQAEIERLKADLSALRALVSQH